MEKKPPLIMTPFDAWITTDILETIKLMIPYMPPEFQRMAGIYAKLTEFQNAIYYFQPPYNHNGRRGRLRQKKMTLDAMMEELGPYLPPEASEKMEQAVQMMSMVQMMQNMDVGDMMQEMNMENAAPFADMMQAASTSGMASPDMEEKTGNSPEESSEMKKTGRDEDERMDGTSCNEEYRSDKNGADPECSS